MTSALTVRSASAEMAGEPLLSNLQVFSSSAREFFLSRSIGIFHRCKIHVRRHNFNRRRHGLSRIRSGRKDAFLQLQIALLEFVLLGFKQLLEFFFVFFDCFCLRGVVRRESVRHPPAALSGSRGLRLDLP